MSCSKFYAHTATIMPLQYMINITMLALLYNQHYKNLENYYNLTIIHSTSDAKFLFSCYVTSIEVIQALQEDYRIKFISSEFSYPRANTTSERGFSNIINHFKSL